METLIFNNKKYEVDKLQFLLDPLKWDEDFANAIANEQKIQLTENHWVIINYIRERYLRTNTCPTIFELCKHNHITLDYLKSLFPYGYHRSACKIAGVTYIDGLINHHYMDKVIKTNKPYNPDKTYIIDCFGFLFDPSEWDESFALNKAIEMKMPHLLTDRHWEIIYYLRDKFEKTNQIPTIYQLIEDMDMVLVELEELFPDGYHRGAVKLAGLRI
jgi:tRNA 2-thiouridine synthesizing protein E